MTNVALSALLKQYRYNFANERALQDGIERVLLTNHVAYEREAQLAPGDRIDFMVDRVGLEVKIGGSADAVQRQLERYAGSERVDALLLVSSRLRHKVLIPSVILNKPVCILEVIRL